MVALVVVVVVIVMMMFRRNPYGRRNTPCVLYSYGGVDVLCTMELHTLGLPPRRCWWCCEDV